MLGGEHRLYRLVAFANAHRILETGPDIVEQGVPAAFAGFAGNPLRQGAFGTDGRAGDLELRDLLDHRRQARAASL